MRFLLLACVLSAVPACVFPGAVQMQAPEGAVPAAKASNASGPATAAAPGADKAADKKKGDDDAADKLLDAKVRLEMARQKLRQSEMEMDNVKVHVANSIDNARKDLAQAEGRLKQFEEIDRPNRVASTELRLQSVRDSAEERAEELKQIEIMYREQDLEDMTGEYVVNRGRRVAERSKQQIAIQERELQALVEHELPREHARLAQDVEQKRQAVERAEREADSGRLGKEIALMGAKNELEKAERELEKLEKKAAEEADS